MTTMSRGAGAILCTAVVCLALTAQPASAGATTQQRPPADRNQVKVKVLKAAILGVAKRAQGACDQDDNSPVVAAVVNRLTDRLVAAAGPRTEAEKLPQVAGGWKQIWSNLDSGSPVCTRANQIYQVVSPDGFYWNIAENVVPGGASVQGFLRGQYEVTPDFLRIQFTRQAVSPAVVPAGTGLVALAGQAEAGAFTPLPDSPPVGVRGELQNTYVDGDLRVVRGRDDRPGSPESIFVLVRADATS